ncbi:molybdenum cofactor guanylyltransferase [Bacillus sp. FJAT-50079]|uniref:molybdenum cofactor guanylyltransferase n=1 Tax=Bacillus sp. FJAT-50079 TaxID=2833577 RepID=UPI001BC9A6A0|nr:molybdenum cofactor guanylyltransferase [Bacillus sp. FJAT-50079]MBS4206850.1 molybdenum cofactor guanylyltransferase [Bacillus sp. FJAT-50079]
MKTIILAGGKSSRMGENKALMKISGMRVIDRLIAEFTPISEEIILITNDPSLYEGLPVTIVEDCPAYKGHGPLAGIYTGLSAVKNDLCLIVACDLPFASAQFGRALVNKLREKNSDAVVPQDKEQMHPLFAAYDPRIVEKAEQTLKDGKRSVKALLDQIHTEWFHIERDEKIVWNMNTQDDYIEAVKLAKGGRNK